MTKSFLQTKEWLDFQKHLGRATWRFDPPSHKASEGHSNPIIANIIKHDLPFGKNYLYIPHGPEINFNAITGTIGNEVSQFVSYLKDLAADEKSIFIKIEPLDDKVPEVMHQFKFKRSAKEIQAHKTIILDIGKSEEELLAGMHHKTRYNIKVAEKYGITVHQSSDLDAFWKLLKKTTKRQRFSAHPKDYYKKLFDFFQNRGEIQSNLFFATKDGNPIAGALIVTYGDTAYYLHGGSDHGFRQMMAPFELHWHLIKDMRSRGFIYYDFGGSESIKWPGITRFKLGWGGETKEYPGSFDIPISKIWYLVYKIARKLF